MSKPLLNVNQIQVGSKLLVSFDGKTGTTLNVDFIGKYYFSTTAEMHEGKPIKEDDKIFQVHPIKNIPHLHFWVLS